MGMIAVYKSVAGEAKALLTFGTAVRLLRIFREGNISFGYRA